MPVLTGENELKPCAHCGGKPQCITDYAMKFLCSSFVVCTKCGISTKKYTVNPEFEEISREEAGNRAKQMAKDAWNKRA